MAPIGCDDGFTVADINEFDVDEMSTVLGLFSCWVWLKGGCTAPPIRNCDVKLWYMSGAGAVCKLGGVCMYALYGVLPAAPYGAGYCENWERFGSIWKCP